MAKFFVAAAINLLLALGAPGAAQAETPIRIGFSIAQTGPLSAAGKSGLLALEIWRDDVNMRGGLLGRRVDLVAYDDQSNAAMTPSIYTKLLDVDKVDLIVGPYGTNLTAPIMPLVKQRDLLLIANFALEANEQIKHDNYVDNAPFGSAKHMAAPSVTLCKQLDVKTIAMVAADSESSQNMVAGMRARLKEHAIQTVYDQTYPPNTADFSSIVRTIRSKKPEAVFIASYPSESVAFLRAVRELSIGDGVKLFGGGMVGLQYANVLEGLGPMLNGVVNYNTWVPERTLDFPGTRVFLARYQARAKQAGVDQLGFYLPPFDYAMGQILEEAVTATKSLDHKVLANYIRTHEMKTIVGGIRYGPTGEWSEPRIVYVQFQGIVPKNVDQFRSTGKQVIVAPEAYKTGEVRPFNLGK